MPSGIFVTPCNISHITKGTIANGGRRGHCGHDGHDSRQHCNTAHSRDPLFLVYVKINMDAVGYFGNALYHRKHRRYRPRTQFSHRIDILAMFIKAHLALASQFCCCQFLATSANFAFGKRGDMRQLWAETIIQPYHQRNHCKRWPP